MTATTPGLPALIENWPTLDDNIEAVRNGIAEMFDRHK